MKRDLPPAPITLDGCLVSGPSGYGQQVTLGGFELGPGLDVSSRLTIARVLFRKTVLDVSVDVADFAWLVP